MIPLVKFAPPRKGSITRLGSLPKSSKIAGQMCFATLLLLPWYLTLYCSFFLVEEAISEVLKDSAKKRKKPEQRKQDL
jgi:hypothetical protein